MSRRPRLIILGGLPGSGKTTLARELCRKVDAMHLRIDSIEVPIIECWPTDNDVADLGYQVAYRVAADNLRLGKDVVADSVNPIEITRRAWRAVGVDAGADVVEVEVTCSSAVEHELRVSTRLNDVPGLTLPTWQQVVDRTWEVWESPDVRIDTSGVSPGHSAAGVLRHLAVS